MKSIRRICSLLLAICLGLALSAPAFGAEGRQQSVTVSQSFPEVYVDGKRAGMLDDQWKRRSVLSFCGTVYVPLKTVGLWMGAVTVWDQDANAVSITAAGEQPVCYSVKDLFNMGAEYAFPQNPVPSHASDDQGELLYDMTVTVNGQPQRLANQWGETVYPLLFHQCVYLPIRSVAGWMGKQVLWTTTRNRLGEVHIYDAPTREQLDEVRIYVDAVMGYVKHTRDVAEGALPETKEEYLDKVRAIQSALKTIWTMPAPDFQGFLPMVEAIRDYTEVTLAMTVDRHLPVEEGSGVPYIGDAPIRLRDAGRNFETMWTVLRDSLVIDPEKMEKENLTTYFTDTEKCCARAEKFLNAIISL